LLIYVVKLKVKFYLNYIIKRNQFLLESFVVVLSVSFDAAL